MFDIALKKFHHPGQIVVGEDRFNCEIINISKTGATLHCQTFVALPPTFSVCLTGAGSVIRTCAVSWREDLSIGVLFV
jgi:hypothetical protein